MSSILYSLKYTSEANISPHHGWYCKTGKRKISSLGWIPFFQTRSDQCWCSINIVSNSNIVNVNRNGVLFVVVIFFYEGNILRVEIRHTENMLWLEAACKLLRYIKKLPTLWGAKCSHCECFFPVSVFEANTYW